MDVGCNVPPFSIYKTPIKKPENDRRDYRIIQLDNGLQATLIHDAETDKAAASLDVAVGHLSDPDDMPGLAHFCEHLLFMGTESFPGENDYTEFLAKNNGSSNAYTSTTNTNYYFTVATPALQGALERFSAFFHCPLFSPSCTTREINAVDSEHQKNHQSDVWRVFQLNKHLSKEGHVWSKFGSGNRYSLLKAAKDLKQKGSLGSAPASQAASVATTPFSSRIHSPAPSAASADSEVDPDGGHVGRETRRRLVEWWGKEYCASRMRLCVIGKESLDELAETTARLFSPVQNRGRDPLPMIFDHPFGPNEKGTLVSVHTIMSFHVLEISFPLDYQPPHWKYKPINFISHLVGHEGPGSLLSYLKNKEWATSLDSGPQSLGRGFAMFKITIHMTENGFQNYRSIILAAFKYLSLLRSSKFESHIQKEIAMLSQIHFRFSEKRRPDSYATWISERMAWPVPRNLILSAPQLVEEWDQDTQTQQAIIDYLDSFRINEGRVVLMAKTEEHAKIAPHATWLKEPWYGTEYRVERFDENFLQLANSPNDIEALFLPGPNEFMPSNLDVEKKDVPEIAKRPHLIRETALSQLWHKKDDRFWIPKANVIIDMCSSLANETPRASVMSRLYCAVVNDSLAEFSYDAALAGLSYKFVQHTTGLYLTTNGYNDKMTVLVEHLLERIKRVSIDPKRLEVMREQTKRAWENFFMGQSYHLSDYYGRYLLTECQWTVEEKLKELLTITAEEIQQHVKKLLSQVHVRILVTGNIFKDEAIKIAEVTESGLGPSSLPLGALNEHALVLPEGSNFIWSSKLLNPNQVNSALTYFLHFGSVVDQRLRVTSALLVQILSEPAFNVLRTKEQLGYVVLCSSWTLPGHNEKGLRIVVQSGKRPGYLEQRVEAFLDSMKEKLEQMNDDIFQDHKMGLKKKWLEADKNLSEEAGRFILQINSGHWDFLRHENDAQLLDSIAKEDVLSLFLTHIHPSSPTRAKLSIHMLSQKPPRRISLDAAKGFAALVQEAGKEVSENDWKEVMGTDGAASHEEFVRHWSRSLEGMNQASSLFENLPRLVEKFPVEGESDDPIQPHPQYIQDAKSFKASLPVSADHGPLVEWGDLPVSRF
ncbi:hypothetical protein AMATHDRAFT_53111 [Amanita thiersii Skay4041]|uniref:Peptidase M16 N-terminal domain-containing protein n=1 Tax=Amanita thiersii Skay4041 TaxID=703135 RepID=A0A2A9NXL3_9AGAR|nr:hypothetical protein AMATHDRAFT_53111 [Amanita thiersii Skay4041]